MPRAAQLINIIRPHGCAGSITALKPIQKHSSKNGKKQKSNRIYSSGYPVSLSVVLPAYQQSALQIGFIIGFDPKNYEGAKQHNV